MRLYQQLVLFMLAATVLPLAVVGFWLLRESEIELGARIGSEQRALAASAADGVSGEILSAVNGFTRPVMLLNPENASPEEKRGLLSLLYAHSPMVSATMWVEPATGNASPPLFFERGQGGHPGFDPKVGAERLLQALPLEPLAKMKKGEVALSSAYLHSHGQMSAMAVAVKLGDRPDSPLALIELGLARLEELLAERAGQSRLDLVDAGGRVVASSDRSRRLTTLEQPVWQAASERLGARQVPTFTVEGRQMSVARVPGQLGLFAVASVDERVGLAPVRALRRTVLIAIGVSLALLLLIGFLFTRRLNARIRRLSEGAEAFAEGDLSRRIPVEGSDELAELSETFNKMGGQLEIARARLMRWNDELKARVEEATAELRAAQERLIEAQKMAAVGQLGAGVAHEINNPLCGILGNAQLLMLDRAPTDPDFETLKKIEQSAKRCKEITQNLLRFAQSQGRAEMRPVDLNAVVRDAVAFDQRSSKGDGVAVSLTLQPGALMVNGDPGQLSQVVNALLTNARTAMMKSAEKTLSVSTYAETDEVVVEVRDSGKGIRPEHLGRIFEPFFTTKDVWSNVGLGLSIAYRVMKEHQGRIDVATEVGKGSTFTLRLPKLSAEHQQRPNPAASPKPGSNVGGQGVGILG